MELTKSAKVGDIVTFGSYPTSLVNDPSLIQKLKDIPYNQYGVGILNGTKYLKVKEKFYRFEDIEWIVLQKKTQGIFKLISKNLVDKYARGLHFLNSVFLNRAFSEEQRSMLQIIIREDRFTEDYYFVDYPTSQIATKLKDSPLEYSDYIKRSFGAPDSYHLQKEVFYNFQKMFEVFNTKQNEVMYDSNFLTESIGVRPVIEVKVGE